jgi:hypothetical protein
MLAKGCNHDVAKEEEEEEEEPRMIMSKKKNLRTLEVEKSIKEGLRINCKALI